MQPSFDLPTNEEFSLSENHHLAEVIREACVRAALAAYEDAGLSGLCHEGAWECAIDAIRSLDLKAILRQVVSTSAD